MKPLNLLIIIFTIFFIIEVFKILKRKNNIEHYKSDFACACLVMFQQPGFIGLFLIFYLWNLGGFYSAMSVLIGFPFLFMIPTLILGQFTLVRAGLISGLTLSINNGLWYYLFDKYILNT